jgi:stringent starvation protein B
MDAPGKKKMLLAYLARGVAMIHLDARREGVLVPERFKGDAHLRLNVSYRYSIPDLDLDEKRVQATLSFGGVPFQCVVPWEAVFGITSHATGDGQVWPEDLPTEVVRTLAEKEDEPPRAVPDRAGAAPDRTRPDPARAAPAPDRTKPGPERAAPAPDRSAPAPDRATPAPERARPAPDGARIRSRPSLVALEGAPAPRPSAVTENPSPSPSPSSSSSPSSSPSPEGGAPRRGHLRLVR